MAPSIEILLVDIVLQFVDKLLKINYNLGEIIKKDFKAIKKYQKK